MNEKQKMYSTVIGVIIATAILFWVLTYAAIWDENIGSSDTEKIKRELWISEGEDIDNFFEERESTGTIRNTEGAESPEMAINEDLFEIMPQVEDTVSKQEALEQIENMKWKLLTEVNLEVTFFPQAPDWDWSLPWKEACEESSIALALHFVRDEPLSKTQFKEDVLGLTQLVGKKYWAERVDTNVDETAAILEEFYDYTNYEVLEDPTIEELKAELAQGNPIVAPFAGKELWNSFFTNGWPRYHMLVIVGYNEEFFLTNDVGTSRGENFAYSYDTIMNSLHDFVPPWEWDISEWAKKVLVLR